MIPGKILWFKKFYPSLSGNLGVIDMIDDMNIKAKTMSNATPQLRGILGAVPS